MNPIKSSYYIRYCKLINRLRGIDTVGNFIKSQKLIEISDYLKDSFLLLPNEIISTSIATFILIFIPLSFFISQINILFGILIPIIVSYALAYTIYNYPINKYNNIQQILLTYSDLAFQDLILVLNTTNSIFDGINFVSKANYPILSEKFKDMIFKINFLGTTPETLINDFINELPNGNLKERLLSLMATKFHPNKLIEQLELLAGEKKYKYEIVTNQLESKLTIIIGICLFFPIITALFISFLSSAAILLSFLMVIIFILFTHTIKRRIIKANFELFGEISLIGNDEFLRKESAFLDFLQFLTFFGNELKLGLPQEIALINAYRAYHGFLKQALENCIHEIFDKNSSFLEGWNTLKDGINNFQIVFLINLVNRMLDKSSIEAGNRLTSIIQQIRANRELIKERESIIKAQQFKIKFLIFILAAILGLIAGLMPLLFQISVIIYNPGSEIVFLFWNSFPVALSLFIMVLYSSFFLTGLVKIHQQRQYLFWTGLIFTSLWYITGYFIVL